MGVVVAFKAVQQLTITAVLVQEVGGTKWGWGHVAKKEYPPFASTWMELEGIMLSEISQSKKDNHHMVSLIPGI